MAKDSLPICGAIRILHVVDAFGVGGLEQVIKTLAISSPPSIQPHICVLRWAGAFSADIQSHNIPIWLLTSKERKGGYFRVVAAINKIIKNARIDVIHCHDLKSWVYCVASARRLRKKIIVTRHGRFDKKSLTLRTIINLCALFTDRIIAVSPDVAEDLINGYRIHARKVLTIPNGINIYPTSVGIPSESAKQMLGLTNDHFVIGTITRFYPVKNLAAQVHLVNQIKNSIPNLAYIIVAPLEGEHYHEISALIDSLNLRKYFHLLGFRRDISTLLSAFNIFVMTSLTEGTSIALLEAMQSGLPVIVSNVGGNRHIIQNGHNGFLFDLNDPHDLEKYTMHLYNNWPLCRLMGKNAAETAKTFSAESMVRKYHDEYCRLFSENEVSVAN